MNKLPFWLSTALICLLSFSLPGLCQQSRPNFEGLWTDPPTTAVDLFCFVFCTDLGIDYLNSLLDDPANDETPFPELLNEAADHQQERYFRPRLSEAALRSFPIDPADDPGFLECEPWGFARQIFAPHQLEIRQYDDRVEFRYAEWDATRVIYLTDGDSATPPAPSPMGYSVGRYEGATLVVETSAVDANITLWWAEHSDQLQAVERYTRSEDGDRLEATVSMEDPWGLTEPLLLRKAWGWAPEEEIFPYEACEPPTEYERGFRDQL